MEPFKSLLNADLVRTAGAHLQRSSAAFDRARFERDALSGLEALEFKARAQHIATALENSLPAHFGDAADMLETSLAPPRAAAEGLAGAGAERAGLAGWIIWPMTEFVARRGQHEPERALQALHAMTQRFSAEWAIRPFIEQHPALSWATLQRWTADPSEHVRRLVSEGSRPRLPWGLQLKGLIADPSPTLPLLRALQDDPSEYVRRSVANHLNDIAKDHPPLICEWLRLHLPDAPDPRRALLRHASRTLIKQGHPDVLTHWGVGRGFDGSVRLRLSPAQLLLGHSLNLELHLHAAGNSAQRLVIDYAVHHVKAHGGHAPKVFKGWNLNLAPGEQRSLRKTHAIKPITTRRYYAGSHRVDVRINGQVVAEAAFELRLA